MSTDTALTTTTVRALVAAGTPGRGILLAIEGLEAALALGLTGEARAAVEAELAAKVAEVPEVLAAAEAATARLPRVTRGRLA